MQVAAKKLETTKYFKHVFKFLRVGSEMTPAGTARVNLQSYLRKQNNHLVKGLSHSKAKETL